MVRIKNRYIVTQLRQETETKELHVNDKLLAKCILSNVEKFFGVYGLGLVEQGFRVKYCNKRTKIAIIRCQHESAKYVKATLPLIQMIGSVVAKFNTQYVGATIIHCNKFIIKHHHRFLDNMIGKISSAKERQDMIQRVMEFGAENKL